MNAEIMIEVGMKRNVDMKLSADMRYKEDMKLNVMIGNTITIKVKKEITTIDMMMIEMIVNT